MSQPNEFTPEQQNYLQGFALGADVARAVRGLPILSGSATSPGTMIKIGAGAPGGGPESPHRAAQDRFLAEGKTLTAE